MKVRPDGFALGEVACGRPNHHQPRLIIAMICKCVRWLASQSHIYLLSKICKTGDSMNSTNGIEQTTQDILTRFQELGVKLSEKDVTDRLTQLIIKFKVPIGEARNNIIRYFAKVHNIPAEELYKGGGAYSGSKAPIKVKDANQDQQWCTVKVKVAQIWESRHESIAQTGIIGDDTGTIRFTTWAKSGAPAVEEGKSYLFKNVVVSEWQGIFSLKVNKNSEITPIDEDITISKNLVELIGAMVDVQNGSGLIKRCPECNRVLSKGACQEHGKVEGIYDLRIKAVVDDGSTSQDVIIGGELTTKLTGITLDKAKEMATEALDQGVVADAIKALVVGRYFKVTGVRIERNMISDSIEPITLDKAAFMAGITAGAPKQEA
jgi:replication factor A1